MTHQLRVRLIGPTIEIAKFCNLVNMACAGDAVDLAMMARVARSAWQPIDVFSADGSLTDELCAVVRGAPVIARRCAGPFQERYGNVVITNFTMEAADDCADEFRALTHSLPFLEIDVLAWTSQPGGTLTVSHVYCGGKRRQTLYQEAA